jgi:hypothetical protein
MGWQGQQTGTDEKEKIPQIWGGGLFEARIGVIHNIFRVEYLLLRKRLGHSSRKNAS